MRQVQEDRMPRSMLPPPRLVQEPQINAPCRCAGKPPAPPAPISPGGKNEQKEDQMAISATRLAQRINEGRISWGFVDEVLHENHVEVRLK